MTLNSKTTLVASIVVGSLAAIAPAAPIAPNQTAIALNENNPVGGSLQASFASPFTTANYEGQLTVQVISGDTSNPYGGYTFVYQLINNIDSANALTRVVLQGYTGYATDLSYKLGTGTVAPTTNDRTANGDSVGFTFLGQPIGLGTLSAGASSEFLVVQTNASSFAPRGANISNGAVSSITTYGPSGAITPEPATLAALVGGSLLIGRRRQA